MVWSLNINHPRVWFNLVLIFMGYKICSRLKLLFYKHRVSLRAGLYCCVTAKKKDNTAQFNKVTVGSVCSNNDSQFCHKQGLFYLLSLQQIFCTEHNSWNLLLIKQFHITNHFQNDILFFDIFGYATSYTMQSLCTCPSFSALVNVMGQFK
jgi:hypothetical protein